MLLKSLARPQRVRWPTRLHINGLTTSGQWLLATNSNPISNHPLPRTPISTLLSTARHYSSSSASSTRWKARRASDSFSRDAKVAGLKSRAAFKLLQISDKHKIFKRGGTVVDLGYAPGSWSQVAVTRTAPRGRVVGVDILPAQPPKGVSTIQGDFRSPEIQAEVRAYVQDPQRGRPRQQAFFRTFDEAQEEEEEEEEYEDDEDEVEEFLREEGERQEPAIVEQPGYIELERQTSQDQSQGAGRRGDEAATVVDRDKMSQRQKDEADGRVVDVVLSDMSEPWEQTAGFGKRSISDPYNRMMNTSGNPFRDHVGSMDLCAAALSFSFDTLRTGGHLVCKFYQGGEDKQFENKLKRLFEKVHRDKPAASRSESREGYFVALRRKSAPSKQDVFGD